MNKEFRRKVLARDVVFGTMLTVGHQTVAEALGKVGYDWLFIESEHAPNTGEILQGLVLAAGSTPVLVRLESNEELSIRRALDSGAAGVIAPKVKSREAAELIVQHAKFPPDGTRGIGISRANNFGQNIENYVKVANAAITVVVQIEDLEGIENLVEIIQVDGVDAVFLGPYDLSASMGCVGDMDNVELQKKIKYVREVCEEKKIALGIYEKSVETVDQRIREGFSIFAISSDIACITGFGKSLMKIFR